MNITRPRIALCLSGQPRTWRHCVDSLFRFFSCADVDVYIHSWDEGDASETDAIRTRYQPVWMTVEARPDFMPQKQEMLRRFPINPQFFAYDMAYSFCASLKAALTSAKSYDHYARVRFDSLFDGTLEADRLTRKRIWLFDSKNSFRFNDLYAHGDADVMTVYAGFYDWLCGSLAEYDQPRFVVEYALAKYLRNRAVAMAYMPSAQMKLLRHEMVGRAFANVRRDIAFEIEKTRQQIQEAESQTVEISSPYYKEAGTVYAAMNALSELDVTARQHLLSGTWAERLVQCEYLINTLFPTLFAGEMSVEMTRSVRMAVTLFLNRMTSYPPLDSAGMVLTLLSFEGEDHQLSHQWAADSANETSRLLADKNLHNRAPYLMGVLILHAQIAGGGTPAVEALLALTRPAVTTV